MSETHERTSPLRPRLARSSSVKAVPLLRNGSVLMEKVFMAAPTVVQSAREANSGDHEATRPRSPYNCADVFGCGRAPDAGGVLAPRARRGDEERVLRRGRVCVAGGERLAQFDRGRPPIDSRQSPSATLPRLRERDAPPHSPSG